MNSTNQMANQMTLLLNKIERRLGLKMLKLPDEINKDSWVDVIKEDTIPTYSRYFPYELTIVVGNQCFKDGYYFIDKCVPDGCKILGIKDISWESYRVDPSFDRWGTNFSTYDFVARDYAIDDIAFSQLSADMMSLFNLGIYVEIEYPNKVRLVSVNGSPISRYRPFPLKIFIEHPISLMTISPTMMESFEKLAISDVANYLYQQLKYVDGSDTVFANLDLKLDKLQDEANKRDEIIEKLEEAHTSTANEYQPCIMTV